MRTTHAAILSFLLLPTLPAAAESGKERRGPDGEECDTHETPEYFQARYQWYIDRYGENGVFNPERRLEQLRSAYPEFLKDRAARRAARRVPAAAFQPGTFRFAGPSDGAGRMIAVEPHPSDPNVVYVGAAGGGCWKSADGGDTWRPLTDGLGDLSVGAVALAADPNVIYLGTGEGGYAIDFIPGIGVLRSTDAGETWQLPPSIIATLVYKLSVDPRDPSVVLGFFGGSATASSGGGAFRSTNGGQTWARTSLAAWGDATDVARDPTNPDALHAVFWLRGTATTETARYAKSTDGGQTWTEKTSGYAADPKGRTSIGLSSDGVTVYAMISSPSATGNLVGVYRSTDRGETWTRRLATSPNILTGQGWYDNALAVDPDNSDVVLLGGGGSGHYRSTNGATNVSAIGGTDRPHVDVHHLVFKKYGSTKFAWTANDGGVWRSTDGGVLWQNKNRTLGTRQYYSISMDPARPDILYGGTQDNSTNRIDASTTLSTTVIGGDGFETAINPDNPAIVYGSSQYATLYRSSRDGDPASFQYIGMPFAGASFSATGGDGASPGVKPFLSWVTVDPNNPRTVYTGTYRVWRSEDAGETWVPLDSTSFTIGAWTVGMAVAKGRPQRLLAVQTRGANKILLSDDRGASFKDLVASGALPPGTSYKNAEIDPSNPDVFFVSASNTNTSSPGVVFKSTDAGVTFTRSDSGLPDFAVEVVRVDPGDSSTVYAGTLIGLFRSTNGGATWSRFGNDLPAAAIHEIRLLPDGSRMAVATHGRGAWIADGLNANHAPVVSIQQPSSAVTIDPGQTVTFAGAFTDLDGDPVTLRWDFGDGSTGTGDSPGAVLYRTPGSYLVALAGEDSHGARGVAFQTVVVRNSNDSCDGAIPLALIPDTTVITRTGNGGAQAAADPSDPTLSASCIGAGATIQNSIWFTLTAPADGTLNLDTLGTLGDTAMALFAGSCGSLGAALACNDDAANLSGGPSKLATVNVTKGTTYRLLVASWTDSGHTLGSPVDVLKVRALFTPTAADVPSPGTTAALPAVLDAFGKGGAHFQSDLVALNRGSAPLTVSLTWGGTLPSGAETTSSVLLPPGAQVRAVDALSELRRQGIPIPLTTQQAAQVSSLDALVTQGDPASLLLVSRSATPNPNAGVGGSFGLFVPGTGFDQAADSESVFVYGLRQNDRDRANLALAHVRTPHARASTSNDITLAIDVFDASGQAAPTPLTVTLAPGAFAQINEVLAKAGLPAGSADGGYARIRRTSGAGRFVVYGVVNDQSTSDGSFNAMAKAGELTAGGAILVPIVLEAQGGAGSFFTSEVVLANQSAKDGVAHLRFVSAAVFGGQGSGTVDVPLAKGTQRVIPNFIQFLRDNGLAIPSGTSQGGALFVTFSGFDATDAVFAGGRTSTPNPDAGQGGTFGVFTPGVGTAGLAADAATIPALRQDALARSNLAVVNAGNEEITLTVSLRSATDGSPQGSTLTRTLAPGEWYQWSNVFDKAGLPGGEGWAVVTRTAGAAPWYAYGVLNDQATSDGSVIPAVR